MPPVSMHSTSVMDMFTCFYAGLDFIEKLAWRESAKKDRLIKNFVKVRLMCCLSAVARSINGKVLSR